jgi:hypothetical protein
MKSIRIKQATLTALTVLSLAGASSRVHAQTFLTDSYTNTFGTGGNTSPFSGSGSVASWLYWYSNPGGNKGVTNDVTMDAGNDPSSGSLLIVSPFTTGDQNLFFGTFGNQYQYDWSTRANLLLFTNVTFDIRFASNTPPNANGNFGTIGVGFITAATYSYVEFARPTIPGAASNGWVHMSVPIDHTKDGETDTPAIVFDFNSYSGYPQFATTQWIDNVAIHITPGPPPPPPTGSLDPVVPGLTQFADKTPSYNRQDIRSDTNGTADLTWYGRTKPVKYSFTIADWPKPGHGGFQVAMPITPDPASSQVYSDPDWSATNVIWFNINAQNDGSVFAGLSYKTNQPSQNSQMFGTNTGNLIPGNNTNGLHAPSAIGKWTLTFTSDTDFTITAPNGAVTNASLPANVAALYNGYVGVFLYSSPASDANVGQRMTFSSYQITGVNTPVNEDFTSGALSSPFLLLNSQDWYYTGNYTPTPPNQIFGTSADAYWFHWSLPDAGFTPTSRSSVAPSNYWFNITNNVFTSGGQHWTKVPKANLPGANQGYFGLVKRSFTQLQVLLPGESPAPNTPSGKTGTPNPITLSVFNGIDVTVRAVDSAWNPVTSTDTVHLTTTDPTAVLPSDIPMVNGVAGFVYTSNNYLQFNSNGVWTVTASDVTDATKTSNTSSPVTVNP